MTRKIQVPRSVYLRNVGGRFVDESSGVDVEHVEKRGNPGETNTGNVETGSKHDEVVNTFPSPERKKRIMDALVRGFAEVQKKMHVRYYYYDEGENYFLEFSENGRTCVYQVLDDGEFFEDDVVPRECHEYTKAAFIRGVSESLGIPEFEVENKFMQVLFAVKQKINGLLDD